MSKKVRKLNPAQQALLDKLIEEIGKTVKRVSREMMKPLTEGEYTAKHCITGESPTVEIVYGGRRNIFIVHT